VVHPVLGAGGRYYALGAEVSPHLPSARDEHLLLTDGVWLSIAAGNAIDEERWLTLVGPAEQCSGRAARWVSVTLDDGEPGDEHRGPTRTAIELSGCAPAGHGPVLAVEGARSASWVTLADAKEPAPGRARALRHALPHTSVAAVARTTRSRVGGSCTETLHEVTLESADGRELASHPGFAPAGAIDMGTGSLLVLVGHDDPNALRVVQLDGDSAFVVFDGTLDLFEDAGDVGC
jgi:hypothetical protein